MNLNSFKICKVLIWLIRWEKKKEWKCNQCHSWMNNNSSTMGYITVHANMLLLFKDLSQMIIKSKNLLHILKFFSYGIGRKQNRKYFIHPQRGEQKYQHKINQIMKTRTKLFTQDQKHAYSSFIKSCCRETKGIWEIYKILGYFCLNIWTLLLSEVVDFLWIS